jgi:hypothetical protein
VPGERLQVPHEGTTLPGYFFRAPGAAPGERRPLVVMSNGSDGPTSHMGLFGGWAANERGYHWMTVDGPGQQASLFLNRLPFRHDWEAVLTPVVDAMAARPDVDPDRFVAAVADPGVVDVATSWTERFSESTRATLHFRGEPYGVGEVLKYRLGDEVAGITTPPADHRARGRAVLARPVPGPLRPAARPKQLVRFTAAEGANRHCEPMGLATRDMRIFDWLDRHLAA